MKKLLLAISLFLVYAGSANASLIINTTWFGGTPWYSFVTPQWYYNPWFVHSPQFVWNNGQYWTFVAIWTQLPVTGSRSWIFIAYMQLIYSAENTSLNRWVSSSQVELIWDNLTVRWTSAWETNYVRFFANDASYPIFRRDCWTDACGTYFGFEMTMWYWDDRFSYSNWKVNISWVAFCAYITNEYLAKTPDWQASKWVIKILATPTNNSCLERTWLTLLNFDNANPAPPPTQIQTCYTGSLVTGYNYQKSHTPSDGYGVTDTLNSGVSIFNLSRASPSFFDRDKDKFYSVTPYSVASWSIQSVMFSSWSLIFNATSQTTNHSVLLQTFSSVWPQNTYPREFDKDVVYWNVTGLTNYLRIVTDRIFKVQYKKMTTIKDWYYTEDSNYSDVNVDNDWYARIPVQEFTRNYRITFEQGTSPNINSIQFWRYYETRSEQQVCETIDKPVWLPLLWDSAVQVSTYIQAQTQNLITQSKVITWSWSSYKQIFSDCPAISKWVDITTFSFIDWWYSAKIPLIDYDIDFHPFKPLGCPLKAVVTFWYMFKP